MIDVKTRSDVRRLCAHVVSRERFGRAGHIGLRWTGHGIGTDAYELRLDGLHRVADGEHRPVTTLADAAAFAGVDLAAPFSVGQDTPAVGDPAAPIALDPDELDALLDFFRKGWGVLESVADGALITLWPEHFDAAFVWQDRANVGASPGDATSPEPYLYVGPWTSARPGPENAWNAPFGAVTAASAPDAELVAFLRDRLALLDGGASS